MLTSKRKLYHNRRGVLSRTIGPFCWIGPKRSQQILDYDVSQRWWQSAGDLLFWRLGAGSPALEAPTWKQPMSGGWCC